MTPDRAAHAPVEAECRVLTRFLVSQDPAPYVLDSYIRLRPGATPPDADVARPIERALLSSARSGPTAVGIADCYAKFFVPRSVLRCRLVLLLAILENSPQTERALNSAAEGSLWLFAARVLLVGLSVGLRLAAGIVLFLPWHVLSVVSSRSAGAR